MVSEPFFASEVSAKNNSLVMINANRLFFYDFSGKRLFFYGFWCNFATVFNVVVIAMAFILFNLTF